MKLKILFATTNDHKIRLFKIAWQEAGLDKEYELVTLKNFPNIDIGDVQENSGSFAGDALLKAKAYAKGYNLPTISQDRGFIFDVLNWPGTDTKKVFTQDEKMHLNNDNWNSSKDEYFKRAKHILAKIDGLDRSISVIHGIAMALPSGDSVTEEFITKGRASDEPKVSISGAGGMFDWFFIPHNLNHTVTEFLTSQEQDQYVATNLYPITPKILDFLNTYQSHFYLET